MNNIISGKDIAEQIYVDLEKRVTSLKKQGIEPHLSVVLIGDSKAAAIYTRAKQRKGESLGLQVDLIRLAAETPEPEVESQIRELAKGPSHGIIIQLPLPSGFDKQKILDLVPVEKDVDGLTTYNKTKLAKGQEPDFFPPAALAVLEILNQEELHLKKKNILLVGSGELIGRPLAALLLQRGISFKLANRFTDDLEKLSQSADIVITGVGKPGLITGDMVRDGVVVIDAGTAGTESEDIRGDVDFDSVGPKASRITPVPGGVGPVTIAMLFQNLIEATQKTRS